MRLRFSRIVLKKPSFTEFSYFFFAGDQGTLHANDVSSLKKFYGFTTTSTKLLENLPETRKHRF